MSCSAYSIVLEEGFFIIFNKLYTCLYFWRNLIYLGNHLSNRMKN